MHRHRTEVKGFLQVSQYFGAVVKRRDEGVVSPGATRRKKVERSHAKRSISLNFTPRSPLCSGIIERREIEGGYPCFYLVTRRSNLTPNLACTVTPHHPNESFWWVPTRPPRGHSDGQYAPPPQPRTSPPVQSLLRPESDMEHTSACWISVTKIFSFPFHFFDVPP